MAAYDDGPPPALLGSTRPSAPSGLLVMLLGVALFAAFVVPAGTYPTLRGDAFSSLFYYANWHFIANGSNYFNQSALTSPLTHTWSLAVEEQFYLVWPLIVLGVFKLWKSTRVLLVVCVVGALASAVEMGMLYSPGDVNRLYYGTDTRAQSLLVGAALAASLSLWADHRHRAGAVPAGTDRIRRQLGGDPAWAVQTARGRAAVLAVGLAGVGVERRALDARLLQRRAGVPRGLLAGSPRHHCRAVQRRLLTALCPGALSLGRPARYVGRISYGMYLWHFPLFIYLDHARTGLTGYPLFAVRVVVTLVVATGSFYLVERPHSTGNPAARLACVGRHTGGGLGHRRRSHCGDVSSSGGGEGARAAPSCLRALHRAAGQGARGGGLDRTDPRHRPQRVRDPGLRRQALQRRDSRLRDHAMVPSTRKKVWTPLWRSSAGGRHRDRSGRRSGRRTSPRTARTW